MPEPDPSLVPAIVDVGSRVVEWIGRGWRWLLRRAKLIGPSKS